MPTPAMNYARALLEAADKKNKNEVKILVDNFLEILKAKNLLNIVPSVLTNIEKLHDTTEGIIHVRIISCYRLTEALIKKFAKIIIDRTGAQEIIWEKEIDKRLLGGVIIQYNDTILDLSLKTRVASLAESMHN